MTCKDFNSGDIVSCGRKKHKVIMSKNGWITVVPINKCSSIEEMIDSSKSVRPSDICHWKEIEVAQ